MATLLLIVIYIAFVGLGIPDSLFGTAWPAIYNDFNLPISFGSFVTVITCFGTITSSMLSAFFIRRFGTYKITLISTFLTALAILGMKFSANFCSFCLFAIPLGLGAGAIDSALNNFVSLHYSLSQMNFLHCFYGIGITISPYLLSLMLNEQGGWRNAYNTTFFIQLSITLLVLISLPLWKKAFANSNQNSSNEEENFNQLSIKEIVKISGVPLTWLLFLSSVSLEMTCASWGSCYLVEFKKVALSQAASMVMYYFLGIAIGRFLSGLLAFKLNNWTIIIGSCMILGLGILGLILSENMTFLSISLMLIGMGNGPMFPNLTYLTPIVFKKENSAAIMGSQISVSYVAMMIMPVFCGLLGQNFGMWIFPFFILFFFIILCLGIFVAKKKFLHF